MVVPCCCFLSTDRVAQQLCNGYFARSCHLFVVDILWRLAFLHWMMRCSFAGRATFLPINDVLISAVKAGLLSNIENAIEIASLLFSRGPTNLKRSNVCTCQ